MRRFKKKPELTFVHIPGLGQVRGGTVLEGDEYAKFCPSLLVEILDSTPVQGPPLLIDSAPLQPIATDAEVVAAVKAHEATTSTPLIPDYVPAAVDLLASVETPLSPPVALKVVPPPVKPVAAKPSAPKGSGKKPPAKK